MIRSLLVALAVAAVLLVPTVRAAAAPSRATATNAHLWLTTPDGQDKLTDMGTVPFGTATPTAVTAIVDPSRTFQTMSGFGGAITDSSAVVLYRLSPAARAATMRSLFDRHTGDGLSYLRQPIGASDFVAQRATPTTTCRPGRPIIASATTTSPTTRPRSSRCCARQSG